MNLRNLTFAASLFGAVGFVACGGIAVIDGEGAGGSSAMGSSSSTDVANSSSATGGGIDSLSLTVMDAFAFADCMPVVPPDPMGLEFMIEASNSSPASLGLSVVAARVVSPEGTIQFDVNPNNLVIAGDTSQQITFEKVPNSATGDNACELCGSTNITLELDLEVEGAPLEIDGPVNSIGCVQ